MPANDLLSSSGVWPPQLSSCGIGIDYSEGKRCRPKREFFSGILVVVPGISRFNDAGDNNIIAACVLGTCRVRSSTLNSASSIHPPRHLLFVLVHFYQPRSQSSRRRRTELGTCVRFFLLLLLLHLVHLFCTLHIQLVGCLLHIL